MRRQNPFRISAMNSLKVHEVHIQDEKQLKNTFKGSTDLRNQLNKNKNSSISAYKRSLLKNEQTMNQLSKTSNFNKQKSQSQVLMEQVAALDNFKVPVTRDKTKNMIENIKIRRRQKHIQTCNNFKEDLDDYKQNLLSIYESVYSDCTQVLSIKESQLLGYLNSQTDQYLLQRQKQILTEIQSQYDSYKQNTIEKIKTAREEIERIKQGRGSIIDQICQTLRQQLIDIAFILQDQARDIENKEKEEISKLQQSFYEKYINLLDQAKVKLQEKHKEIDQKQQQVQNNWKQLKHNYELQSYERDMASQQFINPQQRQNLYKDLIQLQSSNHLKKRKAFQSLIRKQHVDSIRKNNIQKWNEIIKNINNDFDNELDQSVKALMSQFNQSKKQNQQRFQHLEKRLKYIEHLKQEEINSILTEKYKPIKQKNIKKSEELMKLSTSYVQNCDQKQNEVLEKFGKFVMQIAIKNDNFTKQFASQNQKYQLQKAKILDDDQQLTDKLIAQFQACKKQLRQSLHHIKLEEIQKKCFQKIDQIQQAYRKTHEQNKQIVRKRPETLTKFMNQFQAKMAQIFQLYQESKRAQLIQKNKQASQQQALKIIEEEDKKKAQQQLKQAEQIKKKGGKAPPPAKPKDPKKLAAQIQERKKVILAQKGEKKIEQLKTDAGNTWLVFKSLQQICGEFYKRSQKQGELEEQKAAEQPAKQSQQPKQGNEVQKPDEEIKKTLQIDELQQPVRDVQGNLSTTNQSFLRIKDIVTQLLQLRDKIFKNISLKSQRVHEQSNKNNQEMLQQSLTLLDDRLKEHYSLKGKLQSEIFVKRSGQITNHKKRYEKYARLVRQKMDNQTQRFNYLLQKGLDYLKKHNTDQKSIKEQLPNGKNLSQFQGYLSKFRQNFNKFGMQIKQIVAELNRLSNSEVEMLLKKNQDFIKESRLISEGGQYSEDQVKWYKQMMDDINKQINQQKEKRNQKLKQLQEQSQKRRKQLYEKFEKQYFVSIQELSAKDGTGKKYGKPKRIAQQKIRLQMNKCQQAQISIDKQIATLLYIYEHQAQNNFQNNQNCKPQTLNWRKKLMTIQTCIQRYSKHIQAIKTDIKIKPMIRVNYDQSLPDCTLPATSEQVDKKLLQQQLKQLGPLAQQKDDKTFLKYILDIEKIISDEARTIYSGDKAKFLTGNDKLPDFLRQYIANMKKSAEDFRMNSIRQLRQSCQKFASTADKISKLFFCSIQTFFIKEQISHFKSVKKEYETFYSKNQTERKQNLRCLRPNLSNPKCQSELNDLNTKQLQRQSQFVKFTNNLKEKFKNQHFSKGQATINCLINNWEFLVIFYDSLYLFEDFIKVTGDDQQEKKKLDIKKLMIMKQKGIKIDSSSERNIKKKWQGLNYITINFDDKKYSYKKAPVEENTNAKDKKGAKKDTKKQVTEQVVVQNQTNSKQIQTFKTWRQKFIFTQREQSLQNFRRQYSAIIEDMYKGFDNSLKENEMFRKKWENLAKQLFLK